MIKRGSLQLIPHHVLQLVGIERDNMFLELIHVHICGKVSVGDGRFRGSDHRCPLSDVGFINIFNNVREIELHFLCKEGEARI